MHSIEICRQRYPDLIHRYLQGRLDVTSFRERLRSHWAEEREYTWRVVWEETRTQRCMEREQLVAGEQSLAPPSDPRRFPRMLDRLCTLCIEGGEVEPFRASAAQLFAAYRNPGSETPEAAYVEYPPRVRLYERPLPPNSRHRYPCSLDDLRAQLARVPEYDLEGLCSVGLRPAARDDRKYYGVYCPYPWPTYKPHVLIFSYCGKMAFMLSPRRTAGYVQRRFQVERGYGMEIERPGRRYILTWPDEDLRRYISEHVLLHEIGHHVQDRQRWRAGLDRRLPSCVEEQFAEDYAIRFLREAGNR